MARGPFSCLQTWMTLTLASLIKVLGLQKCVIPSCLGLQKNVLRLASQSGRSSKGQKSQCKSLMRQPYNLGSLTTRADNHDVFLSHVLPLCGFQRQFYDIFSGKERTSNLKSIGSPTQTHNVCLFRSSRRPQIPSTLLKKKSTIAESSMPL